MLSYRTRLITGLMAIAVLVTFIVGLANGISSGFAGFWGGLPFWIISCSVLALAIYNFWEECVRK